MVRDGADFGMYRAVRELGKGAMGRVILAERRDTGLQVAVKFLLPQYAADPSVRDRFRLEADILIRMREPNLTRVFETGVVDETQYVVMEYLQGRTVGAELNARGPLPPSEVLGLGIQLLDGLAAAHRAGLIHRDIKPENLFLADGVEPRTLKILDFGIAKVVDAHPSGIDPIAHATATGMFLGTPRWASPEQIAAGPLDARSDVYSAGLCIYALATGNAPFHHLRTMEEIVAAQLVATPPKVSVVRGDPSFADLDLVLAPMIAKLTKDRIGSAEEAASLLRQIYEARFGEGQVLNTTEPLRGEDWRRLASAAPSAAIRPTPSAPALPGPADEARTEPAAETEALQPPTSPRPAARPRRTERRTPRAPRGQRADGPKTRHFMAVGIALGLFLCALFFLIYKTR